MSTKLVSKAQNQFHLFFQSFKAVKCPTDELSLTNCAIVNKNDFVSGSGEVKHICVHTGGGRKYIFSVRPHGLMPPRNIGFSLPQRKWAVLSLDQDIDAEPFGFDQNRAGHCLCSIVLEADFMQKRT